MINLDELEKLAKKATPGPWRIQALEGSIPGMIDGLIYEPNGRVVAQNFDRQDRDHLNPENNAAYIVAANPQAILELIADYKRLQFDVVNLLFRDKFAAQIIEPLALEGNPRARFWMAGFGRKIAIDEPSNYDEAIRTINNLSIELARLRTELAAKSPPPAVAPYHPRMYVVPDPCEQCTQDSDDLYLLPSGDLQKLCRACAEEYGAILAD